MAEPEENKGGEETGGAGPQQQSDSGGDEGGGEGAPAWMATFADMVTLLMCFFVLMFAMSSTQQESFKELVESLQSALGVQQVPEAGTREGLMMMQIPKEQEKKEDADAVDEAGGMVQKELNEIVSNVHDLIMFNQLGGMVKVESGEMGARITISDVLLFPPGESLMSTGGLRIMKKIANILSQFQYQIRIEGHTDNTPIHTSKFPSNWELSANRACEVVRFLVAHGIKPSLLAAVGYGENRPVATNDTADGRASNRRVEIIYERQEVAAAMETADAISE